MKKIKLILKVSVIFIFLTVSAYAKPEPPPKPITADDIVAKMKVQLQLTDQQAVAVKPIIVDYMAKEKQLKLEEKRQLSKVLTGQQLFTWDFLEHDVAKEKKKKMSL